MSIPMYEYILKFIIVGDSSVGKSNLMSRFTDKRFHNSHDMTIGVEFGTKIISRNNTIYKLQIWDTAGQEAFRSITRSFYRGTLGCLLVFDITQRRTFESLQYWLDDIKKTADPNLSIILVGNKIDLIAKRDVTSEEALEFATLNNIKYFETSAKTGENVECSFGSVIDQIFDKIDKGIVTVTNMKSSIQVKDGSFKTQKEDTGSWGCMC